VSVRFREKIQALLWWSDNSLKVLGLEQTGNCTPELIPLRFSRRE